MKLTGTKQGLGAIALIAALLAALAIVAPPASAQTNPCRGLDENNALVDLDAYDGAVRVDNRGGTIHVNGERCVEMRGTLYINGRNVNRRYNVIIDSTWPFRTDNGIARVSVGFNTLTQVQSTITVLGTGARDVVNVKNNVLTVSGTSNVAGANDPQRLQLFRPVTANYLHMKVKLKGGNDLFRMASSARIGNISFAQKFTVFGNAGNDVLRGGAFSQRLVGGPGADTLVGRTGKDRLEGGSGKDIINGGSGNDTLRSGKGADTVNGGKGIDTCVCGSSDNVKNVP